MNILAVCLLISAFSQKSLAETAAVSSPATFEGASGAAAALLDSSRTSRLSSAGEPHDDGPVSFPDDAIPLETASSISDFQALYVTGAKVAKIYGSWDDGYRVLSMKIYSVRESGYVVNKIGVTDITVHPPARTQYFGMRSVTKSFFCMTVGGREYSFELSNDGSIVLKRVGSSQGMPGELVTSLRGLIEARNLQIMQGGLVTIEGLPFYVLGQGGPKGSFLFFRKDDLDEAPESNVHPDLMGDVAEALSDGISAPVRGHPRLGSLRNGDEFHLEMDDVRFWHVVAGPGNVGD